MKEAFYVARTRDGKYAALGHETGMGRVLTATENPNKAIASETIVGLMRAIGGHYRGYTPMLVQRSTEVLSQHKWRPEKEAWDD